MHMDDDFVLVDAKPEESTGAEIKASFAKEVVTAVTKPSRAKRPSVIDRRAAKVEGRQHVAHRGSDPADEPKAKVAKATKPKVDVKTPESVKALPKAKETPKPKGGFRDTKAKMEPKASDVTARTMIAAVDSPKRKAASKAKKPVVTIAKGKTKPTAKTTKALKTAAKATVKAVKARIKAKKPATKAAVKPTNLDGLTRARSRQREGYVAQGMTRAGNMSQVTLTFPPRQIAQMRTFANKGKISMSETARQLIALGLKA